MADQRERVPEYHYESEQSKAVLDALTDASLQVRAAVYDVVAQFWVATATWGLELWEKQVGITPSPEKSLESRRAAILSNLCGAGTTNAEMISAFAQAIAGCDAKVIEQPEDYTFSLRFVGDTAGFASVDIAQIQETVEIIKPAHLQFIIESLRWSSFEGQGMTWADMERYFPTWDDFGKRIYVHARE